MDPPHMTEFASDRYFEKLNQLPRPSSGTHSETSGDALTPSFTLPIRDTRSPGVSSLAHLPLPGTKPVEKGSRKFGLRQLLPSRHTVAAEPHPSAVASSQSLATGNLVYFEHRLFALPNELQVMILSAISLHDLLSLRMVSRNWHALVTLHEAPIVRHLLDCHIPVYALRLYPREDAASVNLHYLCGLWHRLHVAAKLSHLICEWATKEIFLRTTEARRFEFAPQRERMRRRLVPLVFTIFHFFEQYRKLHWQYIRDNGGFGLHRTPYTLNPIEAEIMNHYDDGTLLRVHQVFPLVIASFCRRLRPPTYVGRVERSFRGYLRDKPTDEVHVATLCIGGLRQVEKFWEIKGYNARRSAVDEWYNSISKAPLEAPQKPIATSKFRRQFMAIGRKKPALGDGSNRPTTEDYLQPRPVPVQPASFIFNTSLASGMPMGPLPTGNLCALLPDLPRLQQIWLVTAEALILERRIVERPQDIKRNTQVLFELIREDGFEGNDEWLYGSAGHDSVQPPSEAIEDDPESL